jgi:hypothetical protein
MVGPECTNGTKKSASRNQRITASILPPPRGSNGRPPSSQSMIVRNYREFREIAYGFIGDRLHAFTFTRRGGNIRIISLRKATKREVRAYVEATT